MLNKKLIMILSLLFILLVSISFASASDANESISQFSEADAISSDEPSGNVTSLNGGTFEDIQKAIDNSTDGDTIELKGTFESTGKEIHVTKNLTIRGYDNTVLDGKNRSGIFNLDAENIAIKGMSIVNSTDYTIYRDYNIMVNGSATPFNGDYSFVDCNIENNRIFSNSLNCSFINCSFTANGNDEFRCFVFNAISVVGCNFTNMNQIRVEANYPSVVNCSFRKTRLAMGWIYAEKFHSSVINSTFTDNREEGYVLEFLDGNGTVINCSFLNNAYGAIYCWYQDTYPIAIVKDSIFKNNSAELGACIYGCNYLNVDNCDFIDNSGKDAAAIYGMGNISNCDFIRNSAKNIGAVLFDCGSIINCSFIENSATYKSMNKGYAGAVLCYHTNISNCSFVRNSANNGGAVDPHDCIIDRCTFEDNYARGYGSAIVITVPDYDINVISNCRFNNNRADIVSNHVGYPLKNYANSTIAQAGFRTYFDNDNFRIVNCTGLYKNGDKYKTVTKIVSSAVTMNYKGGKYLTVKMVKDDFNDYPIKGLKVTIKLNGRTYSDYTNDKGQVRILIDLAPKKYTAKITYTGDNFYLKASKNVKVTVKKLTPKLTASKKSFKAKTKTKKYSVTLKDNNKKPMKSKKVTLKVNGKKFTAKTNNNGIATFKITKLTKRGTYKATATFAGNAYYNKVSKSVKITVK